LVADLQWAALGLSIDGLANTPLQMTKPSRFSLEL
jgi:hypothetical protein